MSNSSRLRATLGLSIVLAGACSSIASADEPGWPFVRHASVATPSETVVGAADLTKDGRADVITYNNSTGQVSIWPGDGSGSIGDGTNIAAANSADSVALADMNNDGAPDLVTQSNSAVQVRLNMGDGKFRLTFSRPMVGTGSYRTRIATGDVNGDGNQDAMVQRFSFPPSRGQLGSATVAVYAGDGTGGLRGGAETTVPAPTQGQVEGDPARPSGDLVSGDFDGDGLDDLAFTYQLQGNKTSGLLYVLHGQADSHLALVSTSTRNGGCAEFATGDMNGDGLVDLVGTQPDGSLGGCSLAVFLNDGSGEFGAQDESANRGGFHPQPALADFDGDGDLDAVTSWGTFNPAGMLLFPGRGNGKFEPSILGDSTERNGSVATADFDGDGTPDLALSDSSKISIDLNGIPTGTDDPPDLVLHGHRSRTTLSQLRHGLRLRGSCMPACQVSASITIDRPSTVKRLGLSERLLVSNDAIWDGEGSVKLRTGGAGRRGLRNYSGPKFVVDVEIYGAYLSPRDGHLVKSKPIREFLTVRPR